MLQRKKYIENINIRLSGLKAYIELRNANGCTDINILTEDFICGLLNLLYGYNLVNKNHAVKNSPAYDLVDEKKGVFIQVTANSNERHKIQETIDKFIKYEKNVQDKRLIILLLADKSNLNKPFDTKGLFRFENRNDIWCFKDLSRDIEKLDTERLKKLNDYVESEIYEKPENISQEHTGKGGKTSGIKAVCVAIALMVLCFVAVLTRLDGDSNDRVGKVYYSKIQSYTLAGYYTSAKDAPFVKKTEIEPEKAFSIVSELRNEGKKVSVVEDVYFDIISLEPIEEHVLVLDAMIVGDRLKFYVYNNGWGDAENLDILIESNMSDGFSYIGGIEMISQCTYMADCSEIKSADVLPLAEYVIDYNKYQEVCEEFGCSTLDIGLQGMCGDKIAFSWGAYLAYKDGKYELGYGGMGSLPYKISLFAVLDVDSNPPGLSFAGQNTMSIVEDALVLETVIAPTKSCVVRCQNIFCINGEYQQTPIYTAKVSVPVFADGAIGASGSLTRELAQLSLGDRVGIERIITRYYYQAESTRDAVSATE